MNGVFPIHFEFFWIFIFQNDFFAALIYNLRYDDCLKKILDFIYLFVL